LENTNEGFLLEEKLLKAVDVAKVLNISRALSYRLLESGQIPTIRINRTVRVKLSDLKNFIEAQRFS
jgi:excisionase family DNA binding protein